MKESHSLHGMVLYNTGCANLSCHVHKGTALVQCQIKMVFWCWKEQARVNCVGVLVTTAAVL